MVFRQRLPRLNAGFARRSTWRRVPQRRTDPIAAWHHLVETHDPRGLDALLDDDAVFVSPLLHTPQRGRELAAAYLGAAFKVFFNPAFRCVREIVGAQDAMRFEFEDRSTASRSTASTSSMEQAGKIVEFR